MAYLRYYGALTGKRRLAIEMFKAKHMLNNRLSQHVKITESKRKGKLMEIPGKNLELVLKGLSEETNQPY